MVRPEIATFFYTVMLQAREDELDRFSEWYYFDRMEGKRLPIENYKDDRLAAIKKGKI